MNTLPPLTQELIQAAKAYTRIRTDTEPEYRLLADYRNRWNCGALLADAAVCILTRAIEERRPIPNNGTNVGDWVRVCWDGRGSIAALSQDPWFVRDVCPFRGVQVGMSWARSWVRVKGDPEA